MHKIIKALSLIVVIMLLSACAVQKPYPQNATSVPLIPTQTPAPPSEAEIQAHQIEAEIVQTIIAKALNATPVPDNWDFTCRDTIRDSGYAFAAEVQLGLFQSAMPEQYPDIKTSWANLSHPQCANHFHGLVLRWMDSVIAYGGDGTPELMMQANDALIAINAGYSGR